VIVTDVLPGIRRVEHVMGMPIVVDLRDEEPGDDGLDAVFNWFREVDATFSTYRDDSEISRLNRGELGPGETSADVREVLARCEELRQETRGYFDVHGVSEHPLDPSGLVKGWSVDRAAAILEELGGRNYAISAGGDMLLRGGALPDPAWCVGIQHPLLRDRVAAVLTVTDLAVATSGAYARGDHVIDPHTGQPPVGVLSVTVTGPELATADAYATAAFAMGRWAARWTARLSGYEAMTITSDETVLTTPGFPADS
jgi:thiamine biosynthesis lipoprotein